MYYVLERFYASHPCRWMNDVPYIEDADFDLGTRITVPVPKPLEFTLYPLDPDASDMGPEMPELFKERIPLMRADLVAAMMKGGADNLDVYDAVIQDPDSGGSYDNYKAVNIIGLIRAADMAKSKATIHPGGALIDVDFDGLVVDESRTRGALIFRLAESTSAILVHETLKDHLLTSGFDKLEFLDPGEVAL